CASSIRRRKRCITRARRSAGQLHHCACAAPAASTASFTTSCEANGTRRTTCPAAGLKTSPMRAAAGTAARPWIHIGMVSSLSSAGLFIGTSGRTILRPKSIHLDGAPTAAGASSAAAGQESESDMDIPFTSLFNTTLGHPDLSKVVIPNRKIVGEVLHSYGRIRQLALEVGVAYDTDLAAAVSAVHAVLGANSRVLPEPAPLIFVARLAESIRIGVSPWVDVADYVPAGGELNRAILEAFRDRRIVIPMPQREVHLVGKTA
ncbi:MAG: mechanosensitive ion channel family protein, partial [Betaproteobacteria bacterium]